MSYDIKFPFGPLGHSCPGSVPSLLLVLHSPSLAEQYEKLRNCSVLGSVQHFSAMSGSTDVIYIVFLLMPKHSILLDTIKGKSTPSQLKPGQLPSNRGAAVVN